MLVFSNTLLDVERLTSICFTEVIRFENLVDQGREGVEEADIYAKREENDVKGTVAGEYRQCLRKG